MICTFCGGENREGNRFCGMCGVRLERRKAERRANGTDGKSTECGSCGHLNEPGYKFCGMCGERVDRRTLDRRGAPAIRRATAMANAQLPTPEARRPLDREPRTAQRQAATLVAPPPSLAERQNAHADAVNEVHMPHGVSGPSFLGLNDAPAEGGEYLLEEERSSGRGLRALVLLLVLVAIAGLIFVQYRANSSSPTKSPEMPKPDPAGLPRPSGSLTLPQGLKPLTAAVGANVLRAAAAAVTRASPADADEKAETTKGRTSLNEKAESAKDKRPVKQASTSREADDPESDADPPTPAPNKPSAALIKAQKYLHGQGVRQNCEQGLIYLRAATRENDPGAAIQMGALYASGYCVQQDRVKAYQWFANASQMQPNNRWISKNLDQLWAQMTPQERRQIR